MKGKRACTRLDLTLIERRVLQRVQRASLNIISIGAIRSARPFPLQRHWEIYGRADGLDCLEAGDSV